MAKGFMDKYKTYDTSKGFGSPSQWQSAFESRMNFKVLDLDDRTKHSGIAGPLYDAKTEAELKTTYRKLMMAYHPDRNGDTEENKTISQVLNDVYFELKEKNNWN